MKTEPNKPGRFTPLNDRRIRMILAVFLAVLAWMAVTIVVKPDTTRTIANVPVDYTYESAAYTSRGLSIINAPEKTVTLKLSGDGYTIGGMTAADFVVYPDWSSVRDSGEKTLRLRVRAISGGVNNVNVSIEGTDHAFSFRFFFCVLRSVTYC